MDSFLGLENKFQFSDFTFFKYLEFLPQAMVVCKNNIIVYCNDLALSMLNKYNINDVLEKTFWDLVKVSSKTQKSPNILSYEVTINKKNTILDLSVSNKLINNESYEFISLRDITKFKRQINYLEEKQAAYRNAFVNLPVGIFVSRDKKLLTANDEGLKLINENNRKGILGKDIIKYFSPDRVDFHQYRKDLVLMSKQPVPLVESKIVNKRKGTLSVEVISFPLTFKNSTSIITVMMDISKRKKIEMELLENKEKYKSLIEICPDGICVHDGEKCTYANETYVKIIERLKSKKVVTKNSTGSSSSSYLNLIRNGLTQILNSNKKFFNCECNFETKSGESLCYECTSTKFNNNGKPMILSMVRDVTEKKNWQGIYLKMEKSRILLEKTLEYDKIKSEFFSNISHELKTPLNILFTSLQLINVYTNKLSGNEISKINNYLGIMKQNCYRLLRLINNIIDLTKTDSGYSTLNLKRQDIIAIVEDLSLCVANYLKNKGISLIFDTELEEKFVYCDKDKIERIMLNLFSNSIKFGKPNGKIEVNVYSKPSNIVISVKDNGIGIPNDKLDTIFDRFSQVDKSLTRMSEGSGIGLSLVKNFVDMHKGKIEVKSTYGIGTEFLVYIPTCNNISKDDLDSNENLNENQYYSEDKLNSNMEKINIEFSDIYN